jgi:hypothetical protein
VTPEKKFNLEATYTFYRQDAGRRSASTHRAADFSPRSMGAGFDPVGQQQHPGGPGRPAAELPGGTYPLEIKITDKLSTKVLTQNVNFTVTP